MIQISREDGARATTFAVKKNVLSPAVRQELARSLALLTDNQAPGEKYVFDLSEVSQTDWDSIILLGNAIYFLTTGLGTSAELLFHNELPTEYQEYLFARNQRR